MCFKSNGREPKQSKKGGWLLCVCRNYAVKKMKVKFIRNRLGNVELINWFFTSKATKNEDGINFFEDKTSFNDHSTANLCKQIYISNSIFHLKAPLLSMEKPYKIGETIQQRTTNTEK